MDDSLYLVIFAAVGFLVLMVVIVSIVSRASGGMRKNRRRLMQLGQDAQATVLSLQESGGPLAGGDYRRVKLRLEVMPPGRPSYGARVVEYLPREALEQVQPGSEITVRYDPSRPKSVVLADLPADGRFGGWQAGDSGEHQTGEYGRQRTEEYGKPQARREPKASTNPSKRLLLYVLLPMILLLAIAAIATSMFFSAYNDVIDEAVAPLDDTGNRSVRASFGSYELVAVSLSDPFVPAADSVFGPAPGNRWVLLQPIVRNLGDDSLDLTWSSMELEADDGLTYSPVIIADSIDLFRIRGLAPGAKYTGDLVFELPAGARPRVLRDTLRDYDFDLTAAP